MQKILLFFAFVLASLHSAQPAPPPPFYLPLVLRQEPAAVLISALLYDGYATGEKDEAFQLTNSGAAVADLRGWRLSSESRSVVFPPGLQLLPGQQLWCAWSAAAFELSFGYPPGCEFGEDSSPAVPNLDAKALRFGNTGGRVTLLDQAGKTVDVLVYKGGDASLPGWQGPAVTPYRPSSNFAETGQVLYRKPSGLYGALPDTGSRADWAQDPEDIWSGRKARYPGWQLERFTSPASQNTRARLSVIVAPDHSFAALHAYLSEARSSIRFEGYTFESAELAELLAARAHEGLSVTLLLEGAPAGGVTDQQRWCMAQIEAAGGRVYLLRSTVPGLRERYLYQHAKFWLLDEHLVLVGSENPGPESFPTDDKHDGTLGRRGVYLATDAPAIVERLAGIMDDDLDLAHADVWRWDGADARAGRPPEGFLPLRVGGGTAYVPAHPQPLPATDAACFELVQAPENALRREGGLIGLLRRAGPGDSILVQQLYEHLYWGPSDSNTANDPNPRLEEYVSAARRGARVRILLDSFFDAQDLDDPRSNLRTVEYLTALATREGLDLQARRANPAGLGLHNKMLLAEIDGQGWVLAGSLNGSEVSAKLNREVSLLVASNQAFGYLSGVFWSDWRHP